MEAVAEHIRHRFFMSKTSARYYVSFDSAQPEIADFPDRYIWGASGDFTFPSTPFIRHVK
jgi:hypothetical protein